LPKRSPKQEGKDCCDVVSSIFWLIHIQEGRDDDALTDFKAAAAEGSGFAKSMLVEMNPYAAMCNAMLKNVFTSMADGRNTDEVMEKNLKTSSG
jgi:hypothetical protein